MSLWFIISSLWATRGHPFTLMLIYKQTEQCMQYIKLTKSNLLGMRVDTFVYESSDQCKQIITSLDSDLHGAGFLVCTPLCSRLKAVGFPLSREPVFRSQLLHEVLQTDHTVVGRQGLQLEELTVGNMDLNRIEKIGMK